MHSTDWHILLFRTLELIDKNTWRGVFVRSASNLANLTSGRLPYKYLAEKGQCPFHFALPPSCLALHDALARQAASEENKKKFNPKNNQTFLRTLHASKMQEPSHKRVLPYCLQIIQDMLEQDGLLILAKGLGLHQILLAFLKLYCEPTNLVFFLNAHSEEQEQYVAELKAEGVKCTPHIISADISASERYCWIDLLLANAAPTEQKCIFRVESYSFQREC